jgi:hypothetical protein
VKIPNFATAIRVVSNSRRSFGLLLHSATHGLAVETDGLCSELMGNKMIIVPLINRVMQLLTELLPER